MLPAWHSGSGSPARLRPKSPGDGEAVDEDVL